ncbi:hypothetical protein [Bacillus swezeyi]|uniref:Uncharacterized protein n=1 Tax=Bacillus swezeyi TaxID=1925020 RepID=A0A5M8RJ84_9BACI|nr:hypothetical protein [Bacillus swezeyi]KAA6446916.1 hypothetical protein DX927_22965 [Bacillus swezeyi]KAA6471484.1 hypothetical protein DX928_23205 [Bacillus swezeyi]
MATALAKWMTILLSINIMFAPLLSNVDGLQREAVEVVLTEGAKKASVEGRFTNEIINEMKSNLAEKYSFNKEDISISSTSGLKGRGEYIEASITVPRTRIFVIDMFVKEPAHFTKSTKIMSEYLE